MRKSPNDTNKKVLLALAERDHTNKDLIVRIGLPRRTIYSSLRRLREFGLVRMRPCLTDTRKSWHSLTDQGRAVVEAS